MKLELGYLWTVDKTVLAYFKLVSFRLLYVDLYKLLIISDTYVYDSKVTGKHIVDNSSISHTAKYSSQWNG